MFLVVALPHHLSMIFSKNRFPLFRIMLWFTCYHSPDYAASEWPVSTIQHSRRLPHRDRRAILASML
jgi:hypothetical protein